MGGTEYEERDNFPEEADRGEALDALADGAWWVFVTCRMDDEGDLHLKVEQDAALDLTGLTALLERTLAALPGGK